MGFDLTSLALVNKTVSMGASLLGGIVAGILMMRISLYRALLVFGCIQGCANLSYAMMAYLGKSLLLLIFGLLLKNFVVRWVK